MTTAIEAYIAQSSPTPFCKSLKTVVSILKLGRSKRSKLEKLLYANLAKDLIRPDALRAAITFARSLLLDAAEIQSVLASMSEQIASPDSLGQSPLSAAAPEAIAKRSIEIQPAAALFLSARALSPGDTTDQLIAELAEKYPKEASFLIQHTTAIDKALANSEFKALKTTESRALFLADAIAGSEPVRLSGDEISGLAPSYAHQVAEIGRRSLKRQE